VGFGPLTLSAGFSGCWTQLQKNDYLEGENCSNVMYNGLDFKVCVCYKDLCNDSTFSGENTTFSGEYTTFYGESTTFSGEITTGSDANCCYYCYWYLICLLSVFICFS
jgi:hypothetical protein